LRINLTVACYIYRKILFYGSKLTFLRTLSNIMSKSVKKVENFYSSSTGGSVTKPSVDITKIVILVFGASIVLSLFFVGVLSSFLKKTYNTIPSPKELANIQPSLVTKVYGMDSTLIHEFSIERRFWVPLDSISQDLQNAVVAVEDRRFRTHWGVDLRRIFGTIIVNISNRGYSQGASTLTQQLARNLFFTHKKALMRKVREILTAIKLESYYTKDEILELYLNQVYLGGGVYGVEAASQKYFSKSSSHLTLNEAAVIAGMIQLPEHYRPDKKKNIERITVRRNSVIRGMLRAGFIEQSTYDITKFEEIQPKPFKRLSSKGLYFVETVRQYLEKEYGADKLYNGGLSIYTTLDPVAQDSTEKSLIGHLDTLQHFPNRLFVDSTKAWKTIGVSRKVLLENFDSLYSANEELFKDLPDSLKIRKLQASAIAIESSTGAVRVLIGGRDYDESKYNRALQSVRQPGSAFKPFVYTTALLRGYTPASLIKDEPVTISTSDGLWKPQNYEKEFYGLTSMRNALKRSINLVAIQIFQDVGAKEVISLARQMGLSHHLPAVPALAIGACEVTNIELTSAYSAFSNGGIQAKPYFIESVVDSKGKVLELHKLEEKRVLDEGIAALTASMMRDVVDHGTGVRVRRNGFMRQAAGKTGTTNSYSDAWFVGYTPQIACGVWVGIDERRSMGRGVTGARGTIPVWATAMKQLHRNLPVEKFVLPETIIKEMICSKSYGLATRYCPKTYEELFLISGKLPKECSEHAIEESRDSSDVIEFFGSGENSAALEENDNSEASSSQLIF
jgi:penicillin-binding protein 1A